MFSNSDKPVAFLSICHLVFSLDCNLVKSQGGSVGPRWLHDKGLDTRMSKESRVVNCVQMSLRKLSKEPKKWHVVPMEGYRLPKRADAPNLHEIDYGREQKR